MEVFAGQLINGLSLGSIFLLLALGLNITFGLMGIINFAHGEFMMIGAYTTFAFQRMALPVMGDMAYFASIPIAFLVVGGFGLLVERTMIRHLYRNAYGSILATWGLSLIIMQGLRVIFGHTNVGIRTPRVLAQAIPLWGRVQIPAPRLFIFLLCAGVVAGIFILMYRTRFGRLVQAVMQNRSMAAAMGINTARIDTFTFALGAGIGGVAGTAITLMRAVGPEAGQSYIVDSFMVVCLGGIGGIAGTIAGAFVMGLANPFIEYYTSTSMGKVLLFALIIAFLHFRPAGLVPRKTRALEG